MLLEILLLVLLPIGDSAPIQCSTRARDIAADGTELYCPEGCLTLESTVWGTDIYTDDSSICHAAIHAGIITDAGGKVRIEKKPGRSSYEGSTRNGVMTRSYGAWTESFVLTSLPRDSIVAVECNTNAKLFGSGPIELRCPDGCLTEGATVWGTDTYTDDSSICRAAIHAGKLTDAGGQVAFEKKPGQSSYQESTRNGVTTRSYGAYSGSFILTSKTIVIPPPAQIVPIQCNTRSRDLPKMTTNVICPEKCLTQEITVWGTGIYTDDSSICRAAIHLGILTDAGGQVTVEKKPGQDSYQESTQNGVTTRSYGAWSGSFILTANTTAFPPTTPPRTTIVPVLCNTQSRNLTGMKIKVLCPEKCLSQEVTVWGTGIYTDDSSICRAAIHIGILTDAGGQVTVEKKPGQDSYQESTQNGVTTRSYGAWSGSFILTANTTAVPPTTPPRTTIVPVQCNTRSKDLTGTKIVVLCPEKCLTQDFRLWGTDIYTDDSSICRAAVHAGILDDAGGKVTVEKKPGQSNYQESTRNGVTSRSYGAWPGSFILTLDNIGIPPAGPPPTAIMSVTCQTQAKVIEDSQTDVLCPVGCLALGTTVWGTDIYTDDSPICSVAIHAGILTDAGGRVRVEKRPGQTSYQESTRNGVTTRSYGAWPSSFIVTSLPQVSAVLVQCETQEMIFDGNKTEVLCPEGCLTQTVPVWGTDIYTHDSSICRAAIHAGKITNSGGRVTVEKRPGQSSYGGSTRNGVTTRDYGSWPNSFIFASPPSISKVPDECIHIEKELSPDAAKEHQTDFDAEIHIGK